MLSNHPAGAAGSDNSTDLLRVAHPKRLREDHGDWHFDRHQVCKRSITMANFGRILRSLEVAAMRVLILIVAVVLLLALLGWVTFTRGPGQSSINVETQQIRQDTKELLESGSEALRTIQHEDDAQDNADHTSAENVEDL
jgi:hypothetical protein